MAINRLLKYSAIAVIGQLSYVIIGFFGNITLSRLLNPGIFGQIALLMFFIGISNSLVEGGLGGALIQKKTVLEKDYSTIFIFNLGLSVALSFSIFLIAPSVASYYDDLGLTKPLQALALIPFFNAFCITRSSKLIRDMEFGRRASYKAISLFFATLLAILFSLFYKSIWSLVILYVLNSFIYTVILYFKVHSFSRLIFSRESFNQMFSFGINTTLANVITSIFSNIYNMVIAKYFSITQVGYFYQSKSLTLVLETLYNSIVNNVFFSHLSKLQDDLLLFYKTYNKLVVFISIITALVTSLIYLYADLIINILYGDQWSGSVFYLKVLTVVFYFTIQELLNRNIFKSLGKTYIILVLEIVKKFFYIISIILGIYYKDINILMYSLIGCSAISFIINYSVTKYVLKVKSYFELKFVFVSFTFSYLLAYALLFVFNFYSIEGFTKLLFSPILIIIYLSCYLLFGVVTITDLKKILNRSK